MTEFSNWSQTEQMDAGWHYRVERKDSDDSGQPLTWTDEPRKVSIKEPDATETVYTVTAEEAPDTPAILIQLSEHNPEQLNEKIRHAIVSAVSLSTMPVVRWQE